MTLLVTSEYELSLLREEKVGALPDEIAECVIAFTETARDLNDSVISSRACK